MRKAAQRRSTFPLHDASLPEARPNPTDPAFFAPYVAEMEKGWRRVGLLVPGMMDAYLSSAEFKDDPVVIFGEPASRAEVNEWRQQ